MAPADRPRRRDVEALRRGGCRVGDRSRARGGVSLGRAAAVLKPEGPMGGPEPATASVAAAAGLWQSSAAASSSLPEELETLGGWGVAERLTAAAAMAQRAVSCTDEV